MGFSLGSSDGNRDGSSLGKTLGSSDGIKLGYKIESRRIMSVKNNYSMIVHKGHAMRIPTMQIYTHLD